MADLGAFLRKAGMIGIDRSNPRASMKSIMSAADHLLDGISILILPEGTRTRTGKMLPFKKLPFKLAKKGEDLKEEMDQLIDEIDEVLEENAEEFVKNYVQRGGE